MTCRHCHQPWYCEGYGRAHERADRVEAEMYEPAASVLEMHKPMGAAAFAGLGLADPQQATQSRDRPAPARHNDSTDEGRGG